MGERTFKGKVKAVGIGERDKASAKFPIGTLYLWVIWELLSESTEENGWVKMPLQVDEKPFTVTKSYWLSEVERGDSGQNWFDFSLERLEKDLGFVGNPNTEHEKIIGIENVLVCDEEEDYLNVRWVNRIKKKKELSAVGVAKLNELYGKSSFRKGL